MCQTGPTHPRGLITLVLVAARRTNQISRSPDQAERKLTQSSEPCGVIIRDCLSWTPPQIDVENCWYL